MKYMYSLVPTYTQICTYSYFSVPISVDSFWDPDHGVARLLEWLRAGALGTRLPGPFSVITMSQLIFKPHL